MYDSLLEWCKFPIRIHRHSSHAANGDEVTSAPVTENGYRVDEMRKITDKYGNAYVSFTHIYFPPDVALDMRDMIALSPAFKPVEIKQISQFSEGNNGLLSISVVYL